MSGPPLLWLLSSGGAEESDCPRGMSAIVDKRPWFDKPMKNKYLRFAGTTSWIPGYAEDDGSGQ